MSVNFQRFRDFLLTTHAVSEEQLRIAIKEQAIAPQKKLGEILAKKGFVSEDKLLQILSHFMNYPPFPGLSSCDPLILKKRSLSFFEEHQCLIFKEDGHHAHVAFVDPENLMMRDKVESALGKKIITYVITGAILQSVLDQAFQGTVGGEGDEATDALLDGILIQAVRERASDIHFRPKATHLEVCFRIDGLLLEKRQLHLEEWQRLCIRIKVMGGLDIAEVRTPQHGRFQVNFAGRSIDLRIATHPTLNGENTVLRILDKKTKLLSLDDLGFSEKTLHKLRQLKNKSQGMIIFTGPTGSGKTTSLYALLSEMDRVSKNIMTLEQPLEYIIEGIRQTEVTKQMTYAQGIRSLLRQDPDVMLIGEIRDEETAQMALRASMTGHLVLSTLHTQDAFGVPGRLRDLGLPLDLLADNLICIVAQRLVRKVCSVCTGASTDATPCSQCHGGGFYGRLCVSECLMVDEKMAELIAQNASSIQLKKASDERLWADALTKIESNQTTYDEICRVIGEPMV